jgi:membrane protease YdiL (CAAX protease family)
MTFHTGLLTAGTFTLWMATGTLRIFVQNPIIVHAFLALLFVAASLAFLRTPKTDEKTQAPSLFQKPSGRTGYRLSLGYFIATSLLYMAANPNTWQYTLQSNITHSLATLTPALAVLAAPVYEEIFFRGTLLPILEKKFLTRMNSQQAQNWAIYASSLIFWIFHAPLSPAIWASTLSQGAIPLSPGSFFLGLVCGFIAKRDNSVVFAIVFHAFANLMGPLWGGILPASIMPYFFAL